MKPTKKFYFLMLPIITCSLILGGCSKNFGLGKNQNEIIIWSKLSDKETQQIRKYAEQWAKNTKSNVKVYTDRGDLETYRTVLKEGKGPDIEIGFSEQDLGILYKENLLNEMPEGLIKQEDYFKAAVNAVKYNKSLYAIPLSIDTNILYYNKDKVKNLPMNLEEILKISEKVGFQYDINNFSLSYPFLQANGAYFFKETGGQYDFNNIGLNNSGAIKGYEMLNSIYKKYYNNSNDMSFNQLDARENFKSGKIGFYIGRVGDSDVFDKAGIKYGVSEMPKFKGKYMDSFVNVKTAFVSSKSQDKANAWNLLQYLNENKAFYFYNITKTIPAVKEEARQKAIFDNRLSSAVVDQVNVSTLTLNYSEMKSIDIMNNSLYLVVTGKMKPQEYGNFVCNEIKKYLEAPEKYQIKK